MSKRTVSVEGRKSRAKITWSASFDLSEGSHPGPAIHFEGPRTFRGALRMLAELVTEDEIDVGENSLQLRLANDSERH